MTALAQTAAYMLGIFSLFGFIGWGLPGAVLGAISAAVLLIGLVWTLGGDD